MAGPYPLPPPSSEKTWGAVPKTDALHVHFFSWPFEHAYLPGLGGKVAFARWLHDHSEVTVSGRNPANLLEGRREAPGDKTILDIHLPAIRPSVSVPVVELFLGDG